MIILGIIAAYILIGITTGRVIFVKRLGTSPRQRDVYAEASTNRYSSHYGEHKWVPSYEYDSAWWWAFLALPFWWITIPLHIIDAPTPYEKAEIRKKELHSQAEEIKKLEKMIKEYL
jgi:hypothetical protein